MFCPKYNDVVLKKATEYGAVEIWMNERVRRACANSCADFIYGFLEVSVTPVFSPSGFESVTFNLNSELLTL